MGILGGTGSSPPARGSIPALRSQGKDRRMLTLPKATVIWVHTDDLVITTVDIIR